MEEMNLSEAFQKVVEDNQTRKIILLIENCKTVEEAIEKAKELLNK